MQGERQEIALLNFDGGEKIRRTKPVGQIVVVLKGELDFSYVINSTLRAREGDCFIVPRKIGFNIQFRQPTMLLICSLSLELDFCERLREDIFNMNRISFRQHGMVLHANTILNQNIEIIRIAIAKGFMCSKFMRAEISNLLSVICAFYPHDDVLRFFEPLVRHSFREVDDDRFSAIVMQAQNNVFTVSKLVEMTGLSPVSFRRRFERIFKMKPMQWINENRKRLIREELIINTRTVDEIATMFGFARPYELYRFCRLHFGKSVNEIRKS
jgi:methylphosphotriester-DNA--protein-cysteine methyltransferase